MKVLCPTCKKEIPESGYNIETQLAQCESCESIFQFDVKDALRNDKSYKEVEKPENIEISTFSGGGQMIIHHKSILRQIPILIIVLIFFLVYFFVILPSEPSNSLGLVLPLLIPLFLIYIALNEYLKKTTIKIKNDILSINTKSAISIKNTYWRSNSNKISQIFVKKRIVKSENSSTTYFDLGVETKNGKIHFPITNFRTRQELYFVEVELEKLFGIEDKQHSQEMDNLSILPQNIDEMKTVARELYRSYKNGNSNS